MNKIKLREIIFKIISEEWDKDVEIKSTGEHADKTIAQIKKEMEALKGKKPFNREQFSELMFALRAKQGWKKGKGATGTTEQVIKMKKSELKEIIRTRLHELLSESTNSLGNAYVVYTKALKSFEENANKLKDKVMLKIYKELDKLHLKITQHLDSNYQGAIAESYDDTMQANLPRASFAELDEAKDALESLLKNTRNDRELLKLYKVHLKLTKVFQKHLDKNYPDWDKRMEENAKTINVRHKTTKKKLDIPNDPDTIKKYKKLGYTLWIGSHGKLNEKSESYREAELKKVAQMTDRNQHLEARLFVAKKGGYTKHVKAYLALIDLQDALGHTPRGADQVRSDLDKDLKKYLSKDVDNWKEVWGNL